MLERLYYTLVSSGVPVDRISGVQGSIVCTWMPGATQQQKDAGQAIIDSFDYSQAADDAWLLDRQRQAICDYFRNGDMLSKAFLALVAIIVDELNLLRGTVIGVAQSVWDPANVANGAGLTSPNVTVNGAQLGDVVDVSYSASLGGMVATAYVSAANTINVRLTNATGGAVNLASGTWTVMVRRPGTLTPRTNQQAIDAIMAKITSGAVD